MTKIQKNGSLFRYMRLVNKSLYPDAAVKILTEFALNHGENKPFIRQITVTNCRGAYRGWCSGRNITVRVGSPEAFTSPVGVHYRKRAPAYKIHSWREAFVAILAHEATHARHFHHRVGVDEVTCELRAHAALLDYRDQEAAIVAKINETIKKETDALSALESRRLARAQALRSPEVKLAGINLKISTWERKLKTAQTYLKKYRAQKNRVSKKITKDTPTQPMELS